MYGEQGHAKGLYPTIVAAAFAQMGEPVTLQALPFKRVIAQLAAGTAAAGAVIRTPERLAYARFSQDYFIERVVVVHQKQLLLPYRQIADLAGLRIGVIRGWSYGEAFDSARAVGQFRVDEVENDLQNLAKLASGRVDAVLITELAWQIFQTDPRFSQIRAAEAPLASFGIALALHEKHQPDALMQRFDQAILQLRRSGRLSALVEAEIQRSRLEHLQQRVRAH